MERRETIGLIGIGLVGTALAENLLAAGLGEIEAPGASQLERSDGGARSASTGC